MNHVKIETRVETRVAIALIVAVAIGVVIALAIWRGGDVKARLTNGSQQLTVETAQPATK